MQAVSSAIDFIFSLMSEFWQIITSHPVYVSIVILIFVSWWLDNLYKGGKDK